METGASAKIFDLRLKDLGPYSIDFTRSGRYLTLAGRKGHLALMDWQKSHLVAELQVLHFQHFNFAVTLHALHRLPHVSS